MINTVYKLTQPMVIEQFYEQISPKKNNLVIRPTYLSICKADMRYYLGQRDAAVLKQRLPLSLIHEAVGVVLYDPLNQVKPGTNVVLLPNIAGENDCFLENYRLSSIFRSSKADGFMQEVVSLPREQVVAFEETDPSIAVMAEIISVGVHAVSGLINSNPKKCDSVVVFGDGAVGYIVATAIKELLPTVKLTVVGASQLKMDLFTFADNVIHFSDVKFPKFDHAFECVGGQPSARAINTIIDNINPEGRIILLGVSEEPVAINTRMVLEKGLTLIGRSRSTKEDFEQSISLFQTSKTFLKKITKIIDEVIDVSNIQDLHLAFKKAKSADYKIVLKWNM